MLPGMLHVSALHDRCGQILCIGALRTFSILLAAHIKCKCCWFCLQVTLATSKTTLSDADVFNLVASTITSGKHPADLNGVYFLLTSKDVAQGSARSNFCGSYCGWHTHGSVAGVGNIKYSWVGESGLCSVQAQWINPAVYLLAACSCFVC